MCTSRRILDGLSDVQQIGVGITALAYPVASALKNLPHFEFDPSAYDSFLDWLPEWAFFGGTISFLKGLHLWLFEKESGIFTYRENQIRWLKAFAQMGSAGYLMYGGYEAKTALAAGAASTTVMPLLFLKFAFNAAVEFLIAFDDYKKLGLIDKIIDLGGKKKNLALANVMSKGIALAGWGILALAALFSNPPFLLMMGSFYLCVVAGASALKCLAYSSSFFSCCSRESNNNTTLGSRLRSRSPSSSPE